METSGLIARAYDFGMIQMQEEISALVDLLRARGSLRNVLEIGSESGGTFYLWCRLASLGGLKISLDKPDGTSGSGRFVDPLALEARTAQFESWSANVRVVTGNSHDWESKDKIASILGPAQLDFLFIDGDHTYEGVKQDFEMYREFVRRGGLIGFHDIRDCEHHQVRGCEVSRFWKELQGDKIELIDPAAYWGGIGCLTV